MYCAKCGKQLVTDAKFCPHCGAKTLQSMGLYSQQNSDEEDLVPPFPLNSRQEFYKFYASRKTTGWTTTFIVLCFLSAGISLLFVCFGSYISLLDVALYLSMGILLRATRHWVCALIPTIYSGIASLISLFIGGSLTGIFAIIAGIICTGSLFKINRAFQEYQYYGTGPKYDI